MLPRSRCVDWPPSFEASIAHKQGGVRFACCDMYFSFTRFNLFDQAAYDGISSGLHPMSTKWHSSRQCYNTCPGTWEEHAFPTRRVQANTWTSTQTSTVGHLQQYQVSAVESRDDTGRTCTPLPRCRNLTGPAAPLAASIRAESQANQLPPPVFLVATLFPFLRHPM